MRNYFVAGQDQQKYYFNWMKIEFVKDEKTKNLIKSVTINKKL
jgi:hypothetical protein